MIKKFKYLLVLILLSFCLGLMSSTYSRYIADATGNIEVLFAKWQILVNDNDITNNTNSTISFAPIIEENEYVAANVVAPTSKGYFDIEIDPTNVDVSFKYQINLNLDNENIPDLIITKYAIIPDNYIEGDLLEYINLNNKVITNTLNYDKNSESFEFKPFTIRIYFEWYEGTNESMSDNDDTVIGHLAAVENASFTINANISFEQLLA